VNLHRKLVAAVLVVAAAAASAQARAAGDATIVIRLITDPSPAGVSWTYRGAGSAFQLGTKALERTIAGLDAGTYTIAESLTSPGAAALTALSCVDPSHDSRTSAGTATASVAVGAGETVTCTFTHRALGPRPSAAAARLAAQLAPTLHLAAAEHYKPIAMQDFAARASLHTGTPPKGPIAQAHPTLFSLPVAIGASYLDLVGAEPSTASRYRSIEQQVEQSRPRPTVYWRTVRQPTTGRLAIEYWFLYLYNDFYDRHEADWEGVTLFLDDGVPLGLTYSQHQGRIWSAWPAAAADNHPVVYVAAGSHANYSLPGSYRVKVCWTLAIRHCTTTRQRDNARGDGVTLAAADYDLQPLGGTGYTGGWGSGTYLLGIGRTKDRVVDPRRRSDYSNPFAAVPAGA